MAGRKRAEDYSINSKPLFSNIVKTNKNYRALYQSALSYAHYELSYSDLKKETIKYLKSLDPKSSLFESAKEINENRFGSVGKYAYILNHGGELPDTVSSKLFAAVEKVIEDEKARCKSKYRAESEQKANTEVPKVIISIQDRLREKAREVAGELEGWIDDFYLARKTAQPKTVEEFVNFFKGNDLKAPHMKFICNSFENRTIEIEAAAAGKDKELIEAYSNFTKPELKKFATFHRNIISACGMMQEVAKVVRAPRKKKPISQEKLVAKLKYKKEDTSLGIVSPNPVHIIGSKEVWVYNTKTRKLAQYKALDERGLTVKGASIDQFSSDSAEKTLRKPAESLAEFKKASKVKLRTFLKELSTVDVPANGKLNEHHIILRIDK